MTIDEWQAIEKRWKNDAQKAIADVGFERTAEWLANRCACLEAFEIIRVAELIREFKGDDLVERLRMWADRVLDGKMIQNNVANRKPPL